MQQLSGLDAAFLALDTPTSTGHVGGVHVVEETSADGATALTLERLTDLVAQRMHLVPALRRRIVQVPFGLDQPYWIEDPDFDLEFHLRELALPSPGTMQQLSEQIARIHSRALDRSRPLWEMYLIQGIEGGRSAVYGKLHHAMIDGIGGQELTAALLDLSPVGRDVPAAAAWIADRAPGAGELLARSAVSYAAQPRRMLRFAVGLVRSSPNLISQVVAPRLPGLGRLIGEDSGVMFATPVRAPATPFNRSVSPHRRIALRTVPLEAVKAVKNAAAVTVNDVVLALAAGALRRWLVEHDSLPDGPLVAAVPVSVRDGRPGTTGGDGVGNRISLMLATLPTDQADPLDRLRVANEATRRAKNQHQALPADLLSDVYQFTMPALMGLAMRANARLRVLERVSLFNLFVSNVPGPPVPLFICGHQVVASYPVSAITDGQGLNITVLSYLGGLHVGITADRDLVPDVERLADHLVCELADLSALLAPSQQQAITRRNGRDGHPGTRPGRSGTGVTTKGTPPRRTPRGTAEGDRLEP